MSDDRPNTCRKCGKPIHLSMVKDHVGRATSNMVWRHWDTEAEADHQPKPRWVVDE